MSKRNGNTAIAEDCASTENAVRLLAKDREERIKQCGEELSDLLKRYRCSLVTQQLWVNGMPKGPSEIVVLAND